MKQSSHGANYDEAMSNETLLMQNHIVIVLVRARNPQNIGAVARAMHDLGYADLRIVNEYPVPFQAAKSAVNASSVLNAAGEFTGLTAALADCTLVFGTTAVGERALEHPLHTLRDAAVRMRERVTADPRIKIALLFGSEKTGLTNEELSHCHALLTIPMNTLTADRHLSMNLGQAAAVCLYEIANMPPAESPAAAEPADTGSAEAASAEGAHAACGGDLERLTAMLQEVLDSTGYTRRHPANSREANVRRLVRRMHLTGLDAAVWTGVFRQVLHGMQSGPSAVVTHEQDAAHEHDAAK